MLCQTLVYMDTLEVFVVVLMINNNHLSCLFDVCYSNFVSMFLYV